MFRRNPDGSLDFLDRVKYMIKSGAENIYPAGIERHILADPRIADAAVARSRWCSRRGPTTRSPKTT